jgi:tetratricopeptide (TPR) repeat protein
VAKFSTCFAALELKEDYMKAYMRRAQAQEALEKYEDALEDYKKVLELDPSQMVARRALMYLPEKISEQREKLKAEMLGKLKELGNAVLNPFGLSTDSFQFQQDPNTGGYSINFKR